MCPGMNMYAMANVINVINNTTPGAVLVRTLMHAARSEASLNAVNSCTCSNAMCIMRAIKHTNKTKQQGNAMQYESHSLVFDLPPPLPYNPYRCCCRAPQWRSGRKTCALQKQVSTTRYTAYSLTNVAITEYSHASTF